MIWLLLACHRDVAWVDVAAGQGSTCGLTDAGEVYCWGWLGRGGVMQLAPSDGPFVGVGVGGHLWSDAQQDDYACAWTATGDVVCMDGARASGLHDVAVSYFWACGLDADNRARCILPVDGWPEMRFPMPTVPLRTLALTYWLGCGHRATDGVGVCWGALDATGAHLADLGSEPEVLIGGRSLCAIGPDGSARCGDNSPPDADGPWTDLVWTLPYTCGLDTSGAAHCYRNLQAGTSPEMEFGQLDVPDATFRTLSGYAFHLCGMTTDDQIVCWGANDAGQLDTPTDPRRSVIATLPE